MMKEINWVEIAYWASILSIITVTIVLIILLRL